MINDKNNKNNEEIGINIGIAGVAKINELLMENTSLIELDLGCVYRGLLLF